MTPLHMTPPQIPRLASRLHSVAVALIAALALAAPAPAHADTYNVVALTDDNVFFYGMSDSGLVVFANNFACSGTCYISFLNGVSQGISSTAPTFTADDDAALCDVPPCSATDNGRTVTVSSEAGFQIDDLYVSSGSNPPQFITTVQGISGYLAINGTGDIVFDSGIQDEWYEAIDTTAATTPEPSSLLLLATGALALALGLTLRRRATLV